MDCLPLTLLSQWHFPTRHPNPLLKLVGPEDTLVVVNRYVFPLCGSRIQCWWDNIWILVVIDILQVFILSNGIQKSLAIIHDIRSLMAINIYPLLHCGQLVPQPLQPMSRAVLRDCGLAQIKSESWNYCLVDFVLKFNWRDLSVCQ